VAIGDHPRIHHNHLFLKAQRIAAVFINKRFQLRPLQQPHPEGKQGDPVFVQIEIKLDAAAPPQAVHALLSKVFLNAQDSLMGLVPEYLKPCMSLGLVGKNADCLFASEILAIPGVISAEGPARFRSPLLTSCPACPYQFAT
jgi:hypothetical protein